MTMPLGSLHHAVNAASFYVLFASPGAAAAPNRIPERPDAWTKHAAAAPHIPLGKPITVLRPGLDPNVRLSNLHSAFDAIDGLMDGWDGPQSAAPASLVIQKAARLTELALQQGPAVEAPAVVPVADGGLQCEWYSAGHRFELYLGAGGEVSAWSKDRRTGQEAEADGPDAELMLKEWVRRVNHERVIAA